MRFCIKECGLKIDSDTVSFVPVASYCFGHADAFSYGWIDHQKVLQDFDGLFYQELEGPQAGLILKTGEEYHAEDFGEVMGYEVEVGKMLDTSFADKKLVFQEFAPGKYWNWIEPKYRLTGQRLADYLGVELEILTGPLLAGSIELVHQRCRI